VERSKRPQASILGKAGDAVIGGLESREHPYPEQGLAGDRPSGEIRDGRSDNAPEAASRSRPAATDRAASALVVM
jgi:hypothetical protein